MGRLETLPVGLAISTGRVAVLGRRELERARDARRNDDQATRALYKTARWQRLRLTILARDLYTCRICGGIEGNTSRLVCDHVERHSGDVERFWAGPFQTLCKGCHDGEKQRLERARHGS
jgi:5-methylcytosine-specific restriction protein A